MGANRALLLCGVQVMMMVVMTPLERQIPAWLPAGQ
jgi:hypothetical protein